MPWVLRKVAVPYMLAKKHSGYGFRHVLLFLKLIFMCVGIGSTLPTQCPRWTSLWFFDIVYDAYPTWYSYDARQRVLCNAMRCIL